MTQAAYPVAAGDAALIAVASIVVPDSHARHRIDADELDSLAHSIAVHGLLQPIVMRSLGGDRHELLVEALQRLAEQGRRSARPQRAAGIH